MTYLFAFWAGQSPNRPHKSPPAHSMRRPSPMVGAAAASAAALSFVLIRRNQAHRPVRQLLHGGNMRLLNGRDHQAALQLIQRHGCSYIFQDWPHAGTRDGEKKKLMQAVRAYNANSASVQDVEQARLEVLDPPRPEQRPHKVEPPPNVNAAPRDDPYYWLRDDERKDPAIIEHLKAETAYTRSVLRDTEDLQEQLYKEMRGRIQEADQGVPQRDGPYMYYSRTEEGKQYRVHCRRRLAEGAGPPSEKDVLDTSQPEEVLLDENKEAEAHEFYMVRGASVSPDHKLYAFGVDTEGGEKFTLHVRDLATHKELLKEPIRETAGNLAWANDNQHLFYTVKDKLDRPYKIFRHKVGSDPGQDEVAYHETDDQFYISISRSKSEKVLYISAGSAVTSYESYLPADQPHGEFKTILPRQQDVEYSAAHRGDHFIITIRDASRPNSEVVVAPMADPTKIKVLIPHRKDVKIEHVEVSRDFLTVFQRIDGLQVGTVYSLPENEEMPTSLGKGKQITFEEPAYELTVGNCGEYSSSLLRLDYTSLTTPGTVIDYNMRTHNREIKKVQPVLGGFDKSKYHTERLWATAKDGTKVPISLVYRKDLFTKDGSCPMLLNGYASYEICNDPYFSSIRISLLDRGFSFAIAHARGGGELGRLWYENGKYLHKKNTFTDFISCAEHLISLGYTSNDKLCIEGRSAGGLTMGAVLNMRPDLFNAAIMGVPFVDVLTTMMDESIPLTNIEKEEWGDPEKQEYYEYMLSYSPVDNIKAAAYPNILVTAGLHDPRVGYWEPAKFVAKLREHKTDKNLLLFKCDMGAGHFSKSGRFDKLHETALEFAFLLKTQDLLDRHPAGSS